MIRRYTQRGCEECESLSEALMLSDHKKEVVSVVGAGGKTTTVLRLYREYRSSGRKQILTTTTHMLIPEECRNAHCQNPDVSVCHAILEQNGFLFLGKQVSDVKVKGFESAELLSIVRKTDADCFIEADGSKHLPIKVPAEHEPVICEETTLLIHVTGLDCLGKRLSQVCFRTEAAERLLEKGADEVLTEQDVAVIASSPQGGKKNLGENMRYVALLNKADSEVLRRSGEKIAEILTEKGITVIVASGLGDCRLEEKGN